MTSESMHKILEIGISLSAEKDFNHLLEKILVNAMELTGCDAGTLYLKDGSWLDFKIMRNNTLKRYSGGDGSRPELPPVPLSRDNVCTLCILEERTISVEDVKNCKDYDFSGPICYDAMTGYHTQSMLVVPMKSREGTYVGVLQLLNALDENGRVCAFADNTVMAIESLASQAAILITNMRYLEDIQALFRSFVRVMSSAIDERTPYNASHTRHMVQYGSRFIIYLNKEDQKAGRPVYFSRKAREEFLMSVWLHDIGKLVLPLEIMDKEARLTEEQRTAISYRFERMELWCRIHCLEGKLGEQEEQALKEQLKAARALIKKVDTISFVTEDLAEQLLELRNREYQKADKTIETWLAEEEFSALKIHKGTLTVEERRIMESHVVFTEKLLSQIEFPEEYAHVVEWTAKHHECLDGSGYPNGLTEKDIPYEVRILTILDVFDALIAEDRPYKPGMPLEKALEVLRGMAVEEGKLDPVLTEQLIASQCWRAELYQE